MVQGRPEALHVTRLAVFLAGILLALSERGVAVDPELLRRELRHAIPAKQEKIPWADFVHGASAHTGLTIQILAGSHDAASSSSSWLKASGVYPVEMNCKDELWRVCVGRFVTQAETRAIRDHLRASGHSDCFMVSSPSSHAGLTSVCELPTTPILSLPKYGFSPTDSEQERETAERILGFRGPRSVEESLSEIVKTRSLKELRRLADDLPDTSALKLKIIGMVADEEYETSRSVKFVLDFADRFRRGELAADQQDYWNHCFRLAQALHEFQKKRWEAMQIWLFVLNGDQGVVAPEPKRVRALVEIAAQSREAAGRQVGSFEDIRYWIWRFDQEFTRRYHRAAAVLELLAAENYADLYGSRDAPFVQSQCEGWYESFHLRYPDCLRERAFACLLEERVGRLKGNPQRIYLVVRKALQLDPVPAIEQSQFGAVTLDIPGGLLELACEQASADGNIELFTDLASIRSSRQTTRNRAPVANQHGLFEIMR